MKIDMYLLSKYGWCVQTDKRIKVGASPLCDVDSRGLTWQSYIHGTCYGRREGAQNSMETNLLPL
jgi:hypothetical protein